MDLFAGVSVRDYGIAHQFLYIEVVPEHAGHAQHTLFVEDFDGVLAAIAERGLQPAVRETYDNGVRHATFFDPDGNEVSYGGAPLE
jgi:catechol 2,3-dioxygenase-like lactoylglutathione lyase family enzyme